MEHGKVGKASSSAIALSDIIERPPGELKPYPGNPRKHSAKQLKKLAAAIRMFGFTMPVLVDETGCLVAGAGALRVMVQQGGRDHRRRGQGERPLVITLDEAHPHHRFGE